MVARIGNGGRLLFAAMIWTHSAQGAAQAPPDAGAERAEAAAPPEAGGAHASALEALAQKTHALRALLSRELDPELDPQSLFELPLLDPEASAMEATRLEHLLAQFASQAVSERAARPRTRADRAQPPDPLLQARLDLDRARLDFYRLPADAREALLADHARRRAELVAARARQRPELDRDLEKVAQERAQALEAARAARSEAERLVSEEKARLLSVEQAQATLAAQIERERAAIAARRENVLRWQRRAREARAHASVEDADQLYDALRAALRVARDELDRALDRLTRPPAIPEAGPDPLILLREEVEVGAAQRIRARVDQAAASLRQEEQQLLEHSVGELVDEVDLLNRERLSLLDHLSSEKRASITGFTFAALDQAGAELRHLTLILRYHRHVTRNWIRTPASFGERRTIAQAAGAMLLTLARWLLVVLVFGWWRRHGPKLLAAVRENLEIQDRERRRARASAATRCLRFVERVDAPLSRLWLVSLLAWLLPKGAERLVEVQLLFAIALWIMSGSLAVRAVDALAQGASVRGNETSSLRLRSLQLVGLVVVAFGLVLTISARLVGHGTIHHWVLVACWLASIPVFLLLVRWWRTNVFEKIEAVRRKTALDSWVLAHRHGYSSFLAASIGAVHLFSRGALRAVRGFLGSFDVSRRLLAYLYRREIDRVTGERGELRLRPLSRESFAQLGPQVASHERVRIAEDGALERIRAAALSGKGGVVAVVGARGCGKTSALAELARGLPRARALTLEPEREPEDTLAELLAARGGVPGLAAELGKLEGEAGSAVLVDSAERLVRPVMGGLRSFDELVGAARRHSAHTSWVFAFDEVAWTFLQRARAPRPTFDDVIVLSPWKEDQVVELLKRRTEQAGIEPSFERLVDRVRPFADELDRAELLKERALGYYRLIWNFAGGNPGVALHMWRLSLEVEDSGRVLVHPFKAFDMQDLERLPDAAIFVLRAVLQMSPASRDDIARATMLQGREIADALDYAVARGYLEQSEGRYQVRWTWFRPISLYLRRRQLLVAA